MYRVVNCQAGLVEQVTVYVEYFTEGIIELIKVNVYLILRINLDSSIQRHVKNSRLLYTVIKQ